jgi:4-hydroxythreonine-4-phosphate dehydrogenase
MRPLPRLLITMGDVAGVGPEIIAKAWPHLLRECRPLVVGDPESMEKALHLVHSPARVSTVGAPEEAEATAESIAVLRGSQQNLQEVTTGQVSVAAGKAAYDFLCAAIDLCQGGQADGIVTCPLHKEGLRGAGIRHPGHTEILAERTGTRDYAMVLYARRPNLPHGLGVIHVTLHNALRDVFSLLSIEAILGKIRLLHRLLLRLLNRPPRLGVAALNPHASDGGLFGDEEKTLIRPAVEQARDRGFLASGPWPSDTLFVRAQQGEFDGVVAMYHDQGHIALKLLSGLHAVNITAGLPLVRTSVAHGTAYDIAGRGIADARGLVEATRVAAALASRKEENG